MTLIITQISKLHYHLFNYLIITVSVLFSSFIASCGDIYLKSPKDLTCELLSDPAKAVISDPTPEFGWVLDSSIKAQSACQILVSSNIELLNKNNGDQWNSGKLPTSNSINVEYSGNKLLPETNYWWKVKVWNENNEESSYSEVQKFRTSDFLNTNEKWPGESKFVQLEDSTWVSEDRQTSTFHSINPIDIINIEKTKWFADFGKAAFATLELTVDSNQLTDSIEIYLGERKNDDLTVNKNPGRSNIGFHHLWLKLDKGKSKYLIQFPVHHSNAPNAQKLAPFYPEVLPFRYVEINTYNPSIIIKDIKQLALYYPFNNKASFFESSDTNLNKVWNLCKYTLQATPFLGIYADGNRERMPYEADAYIQQLGHYVVEREYSIARYTLKFLMNNASWPTEWNIITILMAWQDYLNTGNLEFLSEYYENLKSKTLLQLSNDNGLISTTTGKVTDEMLKEINFRGGAIRDIVDWPPGTPEGKVHESYAGPTPEGERDGYIFTDYNTVVNSFHYKSLEIMSKIAELLGKDDKLFFDKQAEKVKQSILREMLDEESGLFVDGIGTKHSSLHSNMFPLAFGLVPERNISRVVKFIKSKNMACSVYGAQFLLEALFNNGEDDYAISLMTSDSKRSWLNMLRVGSTMTTEAWDEYYKPNLTWNHAWGSAPANIIVRKLMGIEPIKPGFETFRIAPKPGKLKNISIVTPTIRGEIESKLIAEENSWDLKISVPGNTRAIVYVPVSLNNIIIDGKKYNTPDEEFHAGELKNKIELPSGLHNISAKRGSATK